MIKRSWLGLSALQCTILSTPSLNGKQITFMSMLLPRSRYTSFPAVGRGIRHSTVSSASTVSSGSTYTVSSASAASEGYTDESQDRQ